MRTSTSLAIVGVHLAAYLVLVTVLGVNPWPWPLLGVPASALLVTAALLQRRRSGPGRPLSQMERSLGRAWPYWQCGVIALSVYASCMLLQAAIGSEPTSSASLLSLSLMLFSMLGLLWIGGLNGSQNGRHA